MKKGLWAAVGIWMALGANAVWGQGSHPGWARLAQPDSTLLDDVIASEEVIDLVQAWVGDSVVEKNRQHLKGFGGWFIHHTWARYWQKLSNNKQKFVASSSRPYHIFDGPGDEVDINIFMMPHRQPYMDLAWSGFQAALERPRPEKGFRFDTPEDMPLPEPLKYGDRGYLTIECEVTPNQEFAQDLGGAVFPQEFGDISLDTAATFGSKHHTIGMTGTWCMDCNHNCRPEIHPIEWMWWLDLTADRPGSPAAKSWMVTLLSDASNRFHAWTPNPIGGEIKLPFVLSAEHRTLAVEMEFLTGDPVDVADSLMPVSSQLAVQSGDTSYYMDMPVGRAYAAETIHVTTKGGWPGDQNLRYWIGECWDGPQGVQGYLHIAALTHSVLAIRVTMDVEE